MLRIAALIRQFTFQVCRITINKIPRMIAVCAVIHVTAMPASSKQIAVLAAGDILAVFAVFAADAVVVLHGKLRHSIEDRPVLLEKTPGRIIASSRAEGVPVVSPPAW